MMGDNRDNSRDSRLSPAAGGVGFVPAENLIGKAQAIFFSSDGSAGLLEFWRWPSAIRFSRMFHGVR
jgi:signal peptidase I